MRWERLFSDLEAQAEAVGAAELAGEVAERTRIQVGKLRLADRLRGALGHPVRIALTGGDEATGELRRVGPDWVLVEEASGREALVATAWVTGIDGLGLTSSVPGSEGRVGSKLDLRRALRGLARDRAPLRIGFPDATALAGTIDRVGADFVEVAIHPVGELRRHGAVRAVRAVPIGAIAVVRTR